MRRGVVPVLCGAWLSAALGGAAWLTRYKSTAAPIGPEASPLSTALLATDRPTLVMTVHPHCPCTKASFTELEKFLTQHAGRLAAVGQLAASIGHELRNPLAAVRNSVTYLGKRVLAPNASPSVLQDDKRVPQFFELIEQELNACSRIIGDLLDFARDTPPTRTPCPLRSLVTEAIALIPPREGVQVVNDVSEQLPVPELDKDQFRQVLANLVQNATEAVPSGRSGVVRVGATGGGAVPWRLTVTDDGSGMSDDVARKIFEPLYTTKTRGTGLGLAIVAGLVRRHGGAINVQSVVGQGSTFSVELPAHDA